MFSRVVQRVGKLHSILNEKMVESWSLKGLQIDAAWQPHQSGRLTLTQ